MFLGLSLLHRGLVTVPNCWYQPHCNSLSSRCSSVPEQRRVHAC